MIEKYKTEVEEVLKSYFDINKYNLPKNFPHEIINSMAYTTLLGGKRLRAIFCLEACKIFSGDYKAALPVACAYEMLHAQSLIHDDLPSMDNDDLRRGKPSNHKVYGEAIAILAGDALISFGAQIILESNIKNKEKVLKEYLKSAGVFGKKVDIETLQTIHKYKTAALFKSALLSGALVGGASDEQLEAIEKFSEKFGLAFQICDDILDVISSSEVMGKTIGKDKEEQKATYVTLFGLEEAKLKLVKTIDESYDILKKNNIYSDVFNKILNLITDKIKG